MATHLISDKIYTHSYKGYTLYIKQYYINSYSADCSIENCYICHRFDVSGEKLISVKIIE